MIAPWCNAQRLLLKQAKVEVNQSRRMTACVLLLKRVIYGISFYSSTTGSKTAFDGDDVLYMRANLFRLFDARGGLLLEAFSVSVWQKKTNKTRVSGRESTPHTKNIRWRSVVSYIPVLEREIVNRERATSEQPTHSTL